MLIYSIAVIIIIFLGIIILIIAQRGFHKKEQAYLQQLEISHNKYHEQIEKIDRLISMLISHHEFGMTTLGMTSKEELTRGVLDNALKLIEADLGSIMLIERETRELVIFVSRGIPRAIIDNTRMKIGEGIAGKVAQTGKAIFVENIEQDARYQRTNLERYGSPSFITVPMRVKNRIIGVLNVNSSDENRVFEMRDVRLLTILADQAAITLENSDLYENLQQFYLEMVQTLARTMDAKDAYTHEHADRARYYARAVSRELSLPEQIVRHIEYAALMHDIGKIGIEERILHKAGKLTPEEMDVIRKHPTIGNKIIAPVAFLAPVAPMVLYHQEWFNGQGYPDGLTGEEIPLGARIVAIIDAFDAMTSDRPYRKALTREYAVSELKEFSGIQFDPRVVDAFIRVLKREETKKSLEKKDK